MIYQKKKKENEISQIKSFEQESECTYPNRNSPKWMLVIKKHCQMSVSEQKTPRNEYIRIKSTPKWVYPNKNTSEWIYPNKNHPWLSVSEQKNTPEWM